MTRDAVDRIVAKHAKEAAINCRPYTTMFRAAIVEVLTGVADDLERVAGNYERALAAPISTDPATAALERAERPSLERAAHALRARARHIRALITPATKEPSHEQVQPEVWSVRTDGGATAFLGRDDMIVEDTADPGGGRP